MTTSQALFVALVLAVAAQRLWELARSARHVTALRARGARESAAGQMPWMRLVHTSWLLAMIAEVTLLHRTAPLWLALLAGAVFVGGQALRLAAMSALGERWTVCVMTLPGAPPVTGGIFRYVRHPNYLGVVLEIAGLPLVHGAWLTAVVFSVANAVLLRARIAEEEAALRRDNGYAETLASRPRFVPRLGARP